MDAYLSTVVHTHTHTHTHNDETEILVRLSVRQCLLTDFALFCLNSHALQGDEDGHSFAKFLGCSVTFLGFI